MSLLPSFIDSLSIGLIVVSVAIAASTVRRLHKMGLEIEFNEQQRIVQLISQRAEEVARTRRILHSLESIHFTELPSQPRVYDTGRESIPVVASTGFTSVKGQVPTSLRATIIDASPEPIING